jgi:predicted nuclease of predicted toxin-antitoxin system
VKRRLLIDECVNAKIILPAFTSIAECVFVKSFARGADDVDVLTLAKREDCVLLSEDFGFGRLIFARRLPPPPGVILVSMQNRTEAERSARAHAEAVQALIDADGALVVIDFERRRVRPFPT